MSYPSGHRLPVQASGVRGAAPSSSGAAGGGKKGRRGAAPKRGVIGHCRLTDVSGVKTETDIFEGIEFCVTSNPRGPGEQAELDDRVLRNAARLGLTGKGDGIEAESCCEGTDPEGCFLSEGPC